MTLISKSFAKLVSMCACFYAISGSAFELPLFKEDVEAMGYKLPEAVGFSLGYMSISQDINVDSISLSGLGGLDKLGVNTKGGYQESEILTLKADLWLMPFLNIYAIGGKLSGYSETTITGVNLGGLPIEVDVPFRLDLDGYTYGIGTVIAGGYESVFTVVDMSYTKTNLSVIDGEIDSIVISPRVGYDFSRGSDWPLRVWVGAQYQNIEQTLTGKISDLPLKLPSWITIPDDASFTVNQSLANNWNALVGAQYELSPNWLIISEVGLGQRKSFFITLDARF